MARKFASTKVPVTKSRGDIEALIKKHKGRRVSFLDEADGLEHCIFFCYGRWLKFTIRYQQPEDAPNGSYDREGWSERDRMRAYRLCLSRISDRFEEYLEGEMTFEEAFVAHVMLEDGRTGGEWISARFGERALTDSDPPLPAALGGTIALPARVGEK